MVDFGIAFFLSLLATNELFDSKIWREQTDFNGNRLVDGFCEATSDMSNWGAAAAGERQRR